MYLYFATRSNNIDRSSGNYVRAPTAPPVPVIQTTAAIAVIRTAPPAPVIQTQTRHYLIAQVTIQKWFITNIF